MGKIYQSLDDLLNDCTVRVKTKGGHGTGFFVAPGLILTCAHVIEDEFKQKTPVSAYCKYNQETIPVEETNRDEVFLGLYPDLALLRVDIRDHPCVLLGTEFRAFTEFYSYGYTKDIPDGESTTVECEGTLEFGGTLIKLKDGQVKPGASGSPLLNKKTGCVCGMITNTRDRNSDLGGAGVPITTVFAKFPDLKRQNLAFHRRDPRWKDLLEKEVVEKASNIVAALLYAEPGKISKPKHWVGREELSLRVNQLLDQSRRVLLTGMGGIGKTSLAQMLVEERLRAGSKPVIWLEVGGEKLDVFIEALAEQCGDDKILTIPNTEAKKLALKELLEKHEVGLLVFDNVRNLVAFDDLLEAIPDKLPVLVTSRMSFEMDDIIDVSQLPPAEALSLLEKASGAADYSKDEGAKLLCKLFGYHPLALEIAGASMKERRGLSPKALLKRLEANPIKLSSLRRGEIRPLLDDCVADLSDPLQSVFFIFGKLLANRSTPTFLAVYLDKSIEDVTDALDALVVRNLVKCTPEGDVYYLHDLIFHYVQTVSVPEQNKSRLIQTGIVYLEEHRRDFALVGFDLPNLLGIVEFAQGLDLVKMVSYLTIGNFPLQEGKSYADQCGYSLALIGQLDRAIEVARSLSEEYKPTTHYLLGKRGNAAFQRAEYQIAVEKYEEELQLSFNEKRKANVGCILARTLAFCGRKEESKKAFEIAREIAKKLQDDELNLIVLGQESWVAGYLLNDHATALRVGEKQLALAEVLYRRDDKNYERLGHALMIVGSAKLNLAKQDPVDQVQGEVQNILIAYERLKELAEKHEDSVLTADALQCFGEYYDFIGDKVQAQSNFNRSVEILRTLEMIREEQELITLMKERGYSIVIKKENKNENKD